jgi:hypothetical protein
VFVVAIRRPGRRLALAATAAAGVVATGVTAASADASGWVTGSLAGAAAIFAVWLVLDLVRSG